MSDKITPEEEAILTSFENDEWISTSALKERKGQLQSYSRETIKKDKRVNIRISERDLLELKRIAMQEGLPYQTFIASILHKYVNGSLVKS